MQTVLAILKIVADLVAAWLNRSSRQPVTTVEKKDDELQKKFDQIDAREPDFDGAIGRLRDRANRRAGSGDDQDRTAK